MTKEKVIDLLLLRVEKAETNKAAAEALGVSPQYLGDVLRGRTEPAGKMLAALGIERVVTYRKLEAK
jgi:transcriptional regulator with XRE-family HTH domain